MGLEFYIPEKAEKCWAGDPYMLEKAESYGNQAREFSDSLFSSSMINHPWIDNDVPRCVPRLCLFELEGSSLQSKNQPQHFQSARDLRSYFMKSRVDQSSSKTQKRLIILEDIDPRFAELLGVVLEIPPAFFISHHQKFTLSIVDKTHAQMKTSKCWKVIIPRYSAVNSLGVNYKGFCDLFSGNFIRGSKVNHLAGGILHYESMMSYWGQQLGESSWTAVLLVDPPKFYLLPEKVHLRDTSQNAMYLVDTRPENPSFQQVLLDPPNSYTITSNRGCMFDFLTAAHQESSYEYSGNHFSATIYARNFVRAAWEAEIARIRNSSYKLVDASRENDGSIEAIQLNDRRIAEGYQILIRERIFLRFSRREVAIIMRAFQCERESSHLNSGGCQKGKSSSIEEIEQESSIWRFLDKELEITEIQINQHMEEYAQRAALNEAYANKLQTFEANKQTMAANRQARSAGQLTKIATAVVPSTVVASIFSMGGNFAAGEKLFLVYWAISLPVTLALLIWVLHEDISKVWSQLADRRRSKERKFDDSESGTSDREPDSTRSKRNWRKLLRRRRKGATVDEENVTDSHSHSIREWSPRTARSDPIIPADNRSLQMISLNSIELEDGFLRTARTNSFAVGEGSSIIPENLETKKRNTL
ncbi:putative tpr repeat protein oca3 protein [Botrytis fragariae]|uniref:Putative tpr repeat protein oca3 protein n=1 Tax=Botrytis fragariae TaxID=1964551 RepID=A0A8H6ANP7_9HELO|nr:putative tpr repeat protein oca3 protein [Botrytis fragariae]KAF5870709.1 putative tpr repeat protein oca3 protein [Botrytis fragariae]